MWYEQFQSTEGSEIQALLSLHVPLLSTWIRLISCISLSLSLSLSLFTFPSQLEIIKAIQGHKISLKCDCRITNYSVEIRSCISYSDMYISYQYIYMIMILDCFSQKRICSEKYWFKELIILLFHSFFFPFSSEPLWKLLQSDHLQPALLPFFLLSLSLSIVYAVTVYQSIGSMHLKGKLAFFHQLPCQYKWNFSPFPQENRLFKASILSLVRSL